MGKCLAGCDSPYVEIKVCDTCFHKDVCGDRDYLTENNCFEFCSKDEIQRWKDLAEQGMLVELPVPIGEMVWKIKYQRRNGEIYYYGIEPCDFKLILLERFGDTVFKTKEEAEARLAELEVAE